jgi:hypothetical protein
MAKVEDNGQNFAACMNGNCDACPSFPGVEGEGLYCARGGTKGEVERAGCNCPDCPVWAQCGLGRTYYCDQ